MSRKNDIIIILAAAFLIMVSSASAAEGPAAADELATGRFSDSYVGSDIAQGGNATNMDLTTNLSTTKWQGYFGNVSGSLKLGAGTDVFYDFSGVLIDAVFAGQNDTFDFSLIAAGAAADVDTIWGYAPTDSDSAQNVFTGQTDILTINNAPSAELEPIGTDWNCTILSNGASAQKDDFLFGVNAQPATTSCFDGSTCQYELIVPADGSTGEVYYFYVSLQ